MASGNNYLGCDWVLTYFLKNKCHRAENEQFYGCALYHLNFFLNSDTEESCQKFHLKKAPCQVQ